MAKEVQHHVHKNKILDIRGLERRLAHEQRVHDHTVRPDVNLKAVAGFAAENLRSNVVRRAADGPARQ